MPRDRSKTIAAAASGAVFRIGLIAGRAEMPDDCDEAIELRQARAGVLSEYGRMNRVRHELIAASITDEQRAEYMVNVLAEMRALRGDFRVLGNLLHSLIKRRRSAYLSASGVAAQ